MFGNTKNIFLKALIVFVIAGSMSSFVYVKSHQQIEAQVAVTDSLKKEIRTLANSFTALEAETADYVSFKALNNSLDDLQVWAMAHVALGDTGNAETMQGFVDNLFTDIKRLTAAASFGQEKNKRLQIDIMSLSQEIQRIKEEAAKNFEVLNKHLTHKESLPPEEPQEPQEHKPVALASTSPSQPIKSNGPAETSSTSQGFQPDAPPECTYALKAGSKNSTRAIQRTVSRLTKEANHSIVALFDIVDEKAIDLSIQSSSAPDILRKAVHKYVSKVSFVSTDKRRYACNMNFNLQVI